MISFTANLSIVAALVVAVLGGPAQAYLQDYTDDQSVNHSRALRLHRAGNYEEAAGIYAVGCYHYDVVESCLNLGILYDQGRITATSSARAAELANETLQMACDGGMAVGCRRAGIHYASGDGVAQNYATAVNFFRRACEGDDAAGCRLVGRAYERGEGVAQNYTTAANFYRRACEGDNGIGCLGLALLYSDGLGVSQNRYEANRLRQRACANGVSAACE